MKSKKEVQKVSDSLSVKASPHVRKSARLETLMFDMEIALLPVVLFAAYRFGFGAVKVIMASVLACVVTEWIYDACLKRETGITDGSAVVTGLLLGLTLPSDINLYVPVIGGIFATLIVVLLYGGYGQHFMLPALASRCFLLISFAEEMTTYTVDGISSATPLAVLQAGGAPNLTDMFLGNINGSIVEVSTVAVLLGFFYLIVRKAVKLVPPVIYVLSFVMYMGLFGGHGFDMSYIGAQILGGGFIFSVAFFAGDMIINPKTVAGQVIYGVLMGVLTGVYRTMGFAPESVSYAIICCNLLIPLIDKFLPGKAKEAA
ncbi:MAG: RnfABCDGE type electron transport complex subunit D [Lachnospiraceae bacterium]|jgi:electron transport complex protein RnfD|nr:RnfABCDGE type electron transport complex subunit D [Lachnospiraceae bacterium]